MKLEAHRDGIREGLNEKPKAARDKVDETFSIDLEEFVAYQNIKSEFFTKGVITEGAAQFIYEALGENMNGGNGGWAEGTDTATKVTVSKLMQELLETKLRARMANLS